MASERRMTLKCAYSGQPRHEIVTEPTPLVPAPNLSREMGIDLLIKRDDVAGPTIGGNKARQLEYYFGAARTARADTILITGAVQSNFARLAAAVANGCGMQAIIQQEERVPDTSPRYHISGNAMLDHLLGAEILRFPEGEDEAGADAALYARATVLSRAGRIPYVIPLSEAHPPLGALGYVRAAHEIMAQSPDIDVFVVGSGSGATHAGLLAGLRGAGSSARVIGGCVRRDRSAQALRIARITRRLAGLYDGADQVCDSDIVLWDGALAPGYGQLGPPARAAIDMAARYEGLLLDPVYTAKAFAAIPALVQSGDIAPGGRVAFIHTGGLGALFAYGDALMNDAVGGPGGVT